MNLKVYGIVQGVGFRPFVSRIAAKYQIKGSVCNKGPYVEIFAQGTEASMQAFCHALEADAPERSAILKIDRQKKTGLQGFSDFSIIESAKERGDIFVSPDIAICEQCKKELFDAKNRRYLHPFINCTACGPRLTILDSMPYDRERTSMGEFPMCKACEEEYTHAETRRYDAQPVCCNDCGPEVYISGSNEHGAAAITHTRKIIAAGGIAAIKGIGGFHLCCDASNEEAVQRLRSLKHRPVKPFAVMLKNLHTAERECMISQAQAELLNGHQKPIILLKKKPLGRLVPAIAPGNPKVGVMLPYAPVQLLLFDYPDGIIMPDCLVMTSGNPSGAPICRTDQDVNSQLVGLCDIVLSHNRKIRLRADDSVMDFFEDKPYMIRRSRGYAPLPIMLSGNWTGEVLGIGGELKNTFCLAHDALLYPSPYIGDMSDLRTVLALKESIIRMETLLETKPSLVACDLHPRYNTTQTAKELRLPILPVQHHYAHILSCMAENDYLLPVIGVSFDGTGYGTDGTIWGGEFLRADLQGFERLGSIQPFRQTGGDKASIEGWRIAVAMLYAQTGSQEETARLVKKLHLCNEKDLPAQFFMADQNVNCITSTSAGRLFDAVSALLGIRQASTFEGEASMYLEFAAGAWLQDHGQHQTAETPPSFACAEDGRFLLPTSKLFQSLTEQYLAGTEPAYLAYAFHLQLAAQITAGCERAAALSGLHVIALSGGVFQNQLLLQLCTNSLRQKGFQVLLHSLVPPNDGGLALGQALAAMAKIKRKI